MGFIYLGSPYTHSNFEVMEKRYEVVERYAAYLLNNGKTVYSPITHCHNMAVKHTMPRDFDFWMDHDFTMITACSTFYRLQLPGWRQSKGLTAEVSFFKGLRGTPIDLIDITVDKVLSEIPRLESDIDWLKEHS